jgi:GR25 family glycosyltransferase involved in LPS biosynthesis
MTDITKNWKIYILSIPESDRRTHVEKLKTKLENKGIRVEILDGFYYKSTDVLEKMQTEGILYDSPENKLSLSQIGCFLSHRQAWQRILSETEPNVRSIILEDDMDIITDNENFDINYLWDEITENEVDALVMWKHPDKITSENQICKTPHLLEYYYQWGLCAYYITPQTAEILLNITRFYAPIDEIIFRDIFPKLCVYFTKREHFMNLGKISSFQTTETVFKSMIWEH